MTEKTITSTSYIASTFQNIALNSDITISKIKELTSSLQKASRALILPVLKIEKKINLKLSNFSKNYNEIKSKAENALKEINLNDNVNNTMNITDIQLNQKYANEHEELINFYDNVSESIELFTNVFNSEVFDNLIKGFDKIINDNEIFDKEDITDIDNIEKDLKLKSDKKNIKKKSSNNKENGSSNNGKKISHEKTKIKKSLSANRKKINGKSNPNSLNSKKKKVERDLLEIVQSQFPTSNYVQKISKTFLRRRLFKKVIYKHIFKYNDGSFTEDRLRSSGDSTIYKYGKFHFSLKDNKEKDNLIKFFIDNLKSIFIKENGENDDPNTVLIAGKLGMPLNDLLDQIFRKDLLEKECLVKEATIEFYEFYEELISEFDKNEDGVKIDCDEKILKHLWEDWKMLKLVREFVEGYRKKDGL